MEIADDMVVGAQLPDVPDDVEMRPATQKRAKKQSSKDKEPAPLDVGKLVLRSIKGLKERKGSSCDDISKYMAANCNIAIDSLPDKTLERYLQNAIEEGILTETGGKYKVAARRRRKRSGTAKTGKKTAAKVTRRRKRSRSKSKRRRTRSRSRRRKPAAGVKKTRTRRRSKSKRRKTGAKKATKGKRRTAAKKTTTGKRRTAAKKTTTAPRRRRSRKRTTKNDDDEE